MPMELNIDQLRIVNLKPNGHCLVKGVAGSGKTTVAVNRIPYLINHYLEEGEKY
jgi:superfamily I DNA/RNA helicase